MQHRILDALLYTVRNLQDIETMDPDEAIDDLEAQRGQGARGARGARGDQRAQRGRRNEETFDALDVIEMREALEEMWFEQEREQCELICGVIICVFVVLVVLFRCVFKSVSRWTPYEYSHSD